MTDRKQSDTDALSKGIADLTEAALGVGIALGRTVAEATSRGPVAPPPAGQQGALGDIVHYGVTIVRNVVGLVFSAAGTAADEAGSAFDAARAATSRSDASEAPPTGPVVHQGGTLRIPLSVENPSADAMDDLVFQCTDIEAQNLSVGEPVGGQHIRFEPGTLSIAPRDFEKLTLFIDAPEDAATGDYRAVLGVGDERLELEVRFRVLSRDAD